MMPGVPFTGSRSRASASAADAICYNCPPQWADWASMLKAIDDKLGLELPHDNKNSGQTLSQLLAEKAILDEMSIDLVIFILLIVVS